MMLHISTGLLKNEVKENHHAVSTIPQNHRWRRISLPPDHGQQLAPGLEPYQRSEDEKAVEKIEDMLSGMSEEEKNEELKLMSRRIWMAVLLLRAYGQTGWIDKSAMEKICGDLYDGLLGIASRFELDKDRINYHIYSEFSIAKTIKDQTENEPCDE